MTAERIRRVRVLAHAQKGLDHDTYRLRVGAVGGDSTKTLTRDQYLRLLQGLRALPNAPTWRRSRR